jgi:uncharacterized protein (DUF2147 family)
MKIKKTIFLLIGLVCFLFGNAQKNQDDITGIWLTAGKEPAKIQIYKAADNKFYGKIIWLKNPVEKDGTPRVDANNPDKTKRKNPVNGLQILKGFKFDGDDEWKGGDIYDPESGKTYSSYITLKDKNTLKVRGYVGISLFGRTEVWTRVQ